VTRALIAHQVPRTPDRFSRVLCQNNPAVRSSTARIVPMATPQRMHPADKLVGCASIAAGVVLGIFGYVGWLS